MSQPGTMVSVRILLHGGQVYEISCAENAEVLAQLAEAMSGTASARGFAQLSIERDGKVLGLAIPTSAIAAIEFDPPVQLQWQPKPLVERASYVRIPDFLTEDENCAVLEYAIGRDPDFTASTVEGGAPDYRLSRDLNRLDGLGVEIESRIQEMMPDALKYFGFAVPADMQLETQLTAHADGGFFRIHNDNGSPRTANRVLSYVYYFHRTPRAFQGGQFRLYDSRLINGIWMIAETFVELQPANNTLLLFPSRLLHEVLPTYCNSPAFGDGRFTIHGCLRDTTRQQSSQHRPA